MTESPSEEKSRHVTVAILTFHRPDALERALESVLRVAIPTTPAWMLDEVLVVDNDPAQSARFVAESFAHRDGRVRYVCEPEPGIAAGRNRALDEACGDVLVFIDDDEVAQDGWPDALLQVMASTGAAMVGGPVTTEFSHEPPTWVREGGFFERANPANEAPQHWLRSGNVAIDLAKTNPARIRFDPSYKIGEDAHFSMQVKQLGMELSWSHDGEVVEHVDADRLTVAWRFEREFISSEAWSRATLDIDGSPRSRAGVLARAGVRYAQGTALNLFGIVTRDSHQRAQGGTYLQRSRGTIAGYRAARRSEPATSNSQ